MNPRSVVVWFLISKGYKTYLLLSRNFVTFYPRRDRESPKWAKELLLELAERRYPGVVDPDSLVLAFGERAGRLRANVAPTAQQADPDIRFFERANPGHGRGDELCCLGVIEGKLLVAWPIKRLGRASRGWRRRAPRGSASTERDQSQSHP